ncbi:MAG TPA: hypothetical protein VKS03_04660 [Thermoanaerobaculia bacterium]|nr:hypothetical protein [Thermoanaerobaculia bacterium]
MPKITHLARSGWFWTLVLASALVFPTLNLGAQTPTPTPTPTDLKLKVKVVEVTKSGTSLSVNPVKVKLKRKEEIVVWVTNGESMKIQFKAGNPEPGDPFTDLICRGRICGVLTPPEVPAGVYNYKVVVDGVALDPNVEVIP